MRTLIVRLPSGPDIAGVAVESPSILGSGDRSVGKLGTRSLDASDLVSSGLKVEVHDLSEGDRADLERSSEFIAADPLPLALIGPFAADGPGGTNAEALDIDPYLVADAGGGQVAWGVEAVGATRSGFDGEGVRVAVLDTGIDGAHPAFSNPALRIIKKNFTLDTDDDVHGHGTHCAGTIFGRSVDNVRIGVAPGVQQAFIGKVIPGDLGDLIDALNWAHANGCNVVSMSLGFDFTRYAELIKQKGVPPEAAISLALYEFRKNIAVFDAQMALLQAQALGNDGIIVIAAAGNESRRALPTPYTIAASPPAAAQGIVPVGALGQTPLGMKVAHFSNTQPEVVAPGVGVVSADLKSRGLAASSGTSMACPHVAGLAVLYWQQFFSTGGGSKGAARVLQRLGASATTGVLAPGFKDRDVGSGMPVAP